MHPRECETSTPATSHKSQEYFALWDGLVLAVLCVFVMSKENVTSPGSLNLCYDPCSAFMLRYDCVVLPQDGTDAVVKEVLPGDSVHSLLSILDNITVRLHPLSHCT